MVRVNRSMRRSKSYRNKSQKRNKRTRTRSKSQIRRKRGGSGFEYQKGYVYVQKTGDKTYSISRGMNYPIFKATITGKYMGFKADENISCPYITFSVEPSFTIFNNESGYEKIKANFVFRLSNGVLLFPYPPEESYNKFAREIDAAMEIGKDKARKEEYNPEI